MDVCFFVLIAMIILLGCYKWTKIMIKKQSDGITYNVLVSMKVTF